MSETNGKFTYFIVSCVTGKMGMRPGNFDYDYEPHDAIDRMIDHCNPVCMDCGELDENCDCPNFVYGENTGDFNPDQDPNFDFDEVMSQISGTREWSR